MQIFITFGQCHSHNVGGKIFNKDTVAMINCDSMDHGRKIAFDNFKREWSFAYEPNKLDLSYFPKGLVELNPEMNNAVSKNECGRGQN